MDLGQSYLFEIKDEHNGEESVTKHTGDTGDEEKTTILRQCTPHLRQFRKSVVLVHRQIKLTAPGHFRIGLREFIAKLPEELFVFFLPG
jgi:hypothetical protein